MSIKPYLKALSIQLFFAHRQNWSKIAPVRERALWKNFLFPDFVKYSFSPVFSFYLHTVFLYNKAMSFTKEIIHA